MVATNGVIVIVDAVVVVVICVFLLKKSTKSGETYFLTPAHVWHVNQRILPPFPHMKALQSCQSVSLLGQTEGYLKIYIWICEGYYAASKSFTTHQDLQKRYIVQVYFDCDFARVYHRGGSISLQSWTILICYFLVSRECASTCKILHILWLLMYDTNFQITTRPTIYLKH